MPSVNTPDMVAQDREELSTTDPEKPGLTKATKHVEDEEKAHSVSTTPSKSGPSKMAGNTVPPKRAGHEKHAELFRKDLISAMKLPDTELLQTEEYVLISDTWKLEWERGVQVPAEPQAIPPLVVRQAEHTVEDGVMATPTDFTLPKKFLHLEEDENYKAAVHELFNPCQMSENICRYDLDELDLCWMSRYNDLRLETGDDPISESEMERIMEGLETHCHVKLQQAIRTVDGLGIEYDENVVCDVCRSPEGEDSNEMVFCDACDICVHQACYGIQNIPEGNWLCRTCALNIQPPCVLCPKVGGAMKSTQSGLKWAHISCALWIPEVTIECPDKMEPITNISQIPASRWSLICSLCREREGACIQCAVKACKTAFHVTCAFQYGLDLKTIVDDDGLDIHMKAYCSKHSDIKDEVKKKLTGLPSEMKDSSLTDEERTELRSHRLKKLDEEFYKHVDPIEVADELQLDIDLVDCLYSYWVLKRKMRFDRPLLMPKTEEHSMLAKQRETLIARMNMFIRLRQDLERCRNLCYMVNKREKTRSLLYQLKEELFLREAALFDSEDTSSESLLPCFAHRSTGTFYDKPDTVLEAAQLLEIRGEQIDRENSGTTISSNASAASNSNISRFLSNQDVPVLKSRRNRKGRTQRTDVDSSTSPPPGSQIQQLFRGKMEGLELRGWTAPSGTEVKLDSDHTSVSDMGDFVNDHDENSFTKTRYASVGNVNGQKSKSRILFGSDDKVEHSPPKKHIVKKSCVQKSESKSKQSGLPTDKNSCSLDGLHSSESALSALNLTPVMNDKALQSFSPSQNDGQVELCKRDGVQSSPDEYCVSKQKDILDPMEDGVSSSATEPKHFDETDELRNVGSNKMKNSPGLKLTEIGNKGIGDNVTPEKSKVVNRRSTARLDHSSETSQVCPISSPNKEKEATAGIKAGNVRVAKKAVRVSTTISENQANVTVEFDTGDNTKAISSDGSKTTPKRDRYTSRASKTVNATAADTPMSDVLKSEDSQKNDENHKKSWLKSHPLVYDGTFTSEPWSSDTRYDITVENLSKSNGEEEEEELCKSKSVSLLNKLAEKSVSNLPASSELESSSAAKVDGISGRKQRSSQTLKRRSGALSKFDSNGSSTDSSQTPDVVEPEVTSRLPCDHFSASSEENREDQNLNKDINKYIEFTSSSMRITDEYFSNTSRSSSCAIKVNNSIDRKLRLSRSLRRKSAAANRASGDESSTDSSQKSDSIVRDDESKILYESFENNKVEQNDGKVVTRKVACGNESTDVQPNSTTDETLTGVNAFDTNTMMGDYCEPSDVNCSVRHTEQYESIDLRPVELEFYVDGEKESALNVKTDVHRRKFVEKSSAGKAVCKDDDLISSATVRRLSSNKQIVSEKQISQWDEENEVSEQTRTKTEYVGSDSQNWLVPLNIAVISGNKDTEVLVAAVSSDLQDNMHTEKRARDNIETTEQLLSSKKSKSVTTGLETKNSKKRLPLIHDAEYSSIKCIPKDSSEHDVDACIEENVLQAPDFSSDVNECHSHIKVGGDKRDSNVVTSLSHNEATGSHNPMEDDDSDSFEHFCLEIETEVCRKGSMHQKTVTTESDLRTNVVKAKLEEAETVVNSDRSSFSVMKNSPRRSAEITCKRRSKTVAAKRKRSARDDLAKSASDTNKISSIHVSKIEVNDHGLSDVSNIMEDKSLCYIAKAENDLKADDFHLKAVTLHTASKPVIDSTLLKCDEVASSIGLPRKKDSTSWENEGVVDKWLSDASMAGELPSPCERSTWTPLSGESFRYLNDAGTQPADTYIGNSAITNRKPLSSYFNQTGSLSFSGSLVIERKPGLCSSPVASVDSDSRRDQIRADLMRRFSPHQLVVADSIKQRVIDGLGQLSLATCHSLPVFCCHSRQKLLSHPQRRKREISTRRSSSASGTRPLSINGGCESPLRKRSLPERYRRKTYIQLDYISGDESSSPLKGGCDSSDGETVNLENDSDFKFSDDDEGEECVRSSRTSLQKRRRRRSTIVR